MNNTVHQFWHSGELDIPALLSAKSVIKYGHNLKLWSYDKLEYDSIYCHDASKILDLNVIPKCASCPEIGRKYEQIVSEYFRYKVLFEEGGWWLDNDVVLLRKLRWPHEIGVRTVGKGTYPNVMYTSKPGIKLMMGCFENMNLTKWNQSILEQIKKYKLINWEFPRSWFGKECDLRYFLNQQYAKPFIGVHLCRSWMKHKGIFDVTTGLYGKLRQAYKV